MEHSCIHLPHFLLYECLDRAPLTCGNTFAHILRSQRCFKARNYVVVPTGLVKKVGSMRTLHLEALAKANQ